MRDRRRGKRRPAPATFDVLADKVEQLSDLGYRLSPHALVHLRRFFRRRRADSITPSLIAEYGIQRQQQGAASREINDYELEALRQILHYAQTTGVIRDIPRIAFVPRTSHEQAAADALAAATRRRPLGSPLIPPLIAHRQVPKLITPESKRVTVSERAQKKPGPSPKITQDAWLKHKAAHKNDGLSDSQRARLLTQQLGFKVTDDAVRRARQRYD